MDFFKKHIDTMAILTAFASSMIWMNGKFIDIEHRFSNVEKELAIIKTVMVIKNIMPNELANDNK